MRPTKTFACPTLTDFNYSAYIDLNGLFKAVAMLRKSITIAK